MTGVILAGGRSRRMSGRDKTAMRRDGLPVLSHLVALLREVCGRVALVVRPDQAGQFEGLGCDAVWLDRYLDCGPLAGIHTALEEAEDDVLVVACDLPFLERGILCRIRDEFLSGKGEVQAVVPRTSEVIGSGKVGWRLETLCAVWSRDCLGAVRVALERRELAVNRLATELRTRFVPLTEGESAGLRNINAPPDLEAFGGRLGFD